MIPTNSSAQGITIIGINIFSGCGGATYRQCENELSSALSDLGSDNASIAAAAQENAFRDCKQERRDCRRG